MHSIGSKGPKVSHADSEDSDQTGRMARLICVFAGRTRHFVGFGMWRLIMLMQSDYILVLYQTLSESFAQHWFSGFYSTCIKTVYVYMHLKYTDQTYNAPRLIAWPAYGFEFSKGKVILLEFF